MLLTSRRKKRPRNKKSRRKKMMMTRLMSAKTLTRETLMTTQMMAETTREAGSKLGCRGGMSHRVTMMRRIVMTHRNLLPRMQESRRPNLMHYRKS